MASPVDDIEAEPKAFFTSHSHLSQASSGLRGVHKRHVTLTVRPEHERSPEGVFSLHRNVFLFDYSIY